MPVVAARAYDATAKSDPRSIERGVRQVLADKVCGSHLGMWLLVGEHLRLDTWGLLLAWCGQTTERVEPRLALQLVHESALCVAGLREARSLPQPGFGLLHGLPFLAQDQAVHHLLAGQTIEDAQALQEGLGRRRRELGDFKGELLVIDPHRCNSHTKRRMRKRRKAAKAKPTKLTQVFFAFDADTCQPLCFTVGTPSRTVAQATPGLLGMARKILGEQGRAALVLADSEHFSAGLMRQAQERTGFDLMVPVIMQESRLKRLRALPATDFERRWAGYATLRTTSGWKSSKGEEMPMWVQRFGEPPAECTFNGFVCTAQRDELQAMTDEYPKRWHLEEFFNREQALGWERAGTQNLNVRYGQMTLALLAQAALRRLRQNLGEPMASWQAEHLARDVLRGLEGDVRVTTDTIIVTYYNAPFKEALRAKYEDLPDKLQADGVKPQIPWLYDYKLDFRFR